METSACKDLQMFEVEQIDLTQSTVVPNFSQVYPMKAISDQILPPALQPNNNNNTGTASRPEATGGVTPHVHIEKKKPIAPASGCSCMGHFAPKRNT